MNQKLIMLSFLFITIFPLKISQLEFEPTPNPLPKYNTFYEFTHVIDSCSNTVTSF